METCEARVHGVFMATGATGVAPVVLLSLGGEGYLPIFIGFFEALSIHQALFHTVSPRPLTHDLFVDLLSHLKIILNRVNIDSLEDGVFYATLHIEKDESTECIDCRPSDGIAIAVRTGSHITIDRHLAESSIIQKENLPDLLDFNSFLTTGH